MVFSRIVVALGCLSVTAACSRKTAPEHINHRQRITFHGRALNYKAGAGIEPSDAPLYVEGLEEWPEHIKGKNVTITGVLVERKDLPDPTVDEKGRATSGGMFGPRKILLDPRWVVSEPVSR